MGFFFNKLKSLFKKKQEYQPDMSYLWEEDLERFDECRTDQELLDDYIKYGDMFVGLGGPQEDPFYKAVKRRFSKRLIEQLGKNTK